MAINHQMTQGESRVCETRIIVTMQGFKPLHHPGDEMGALLGNGRHAAHARHQVHTGGHTVNTQLVQFLWHTL